MRYQNALLFGQHAPIFAAPDPLGAFVPDQLNISHGLTAWIALASIDVNTLVKTAFSLQPMEVNER